MQTATNLQPTHNPLATPTVYRVLLAISLVHMLNDSMQAVIPAIFPILERSMHLSFTQIGWISFALSMTSSIMQPAVGYFSDKRPSPFMLPFGMIASFIGMLGLAFAPSFIFVFLTVMFIGLGSAVFHPEGSKVVHMAAGARRGFAQSIYQVGGNSGSSLAPLMTVLIFVPFGQFGAIWFTSLALLAIVVLTFVSNWYKQQLALGAVKKKARQAKTRDPSMRRKIIFALVMVVFIVFARSWLQSGLSNYYQFYLIQTYGVSIQSAQIYLFVFMLAGVIGTFFGGPLADRFGRRTIILGSLLGSLPFAVLLPHVSLGWVYPTLFMLGFILSSSFSVTVVYAQELIPGSVGMASGLIVGLAFGMGALGSVVLGKLADLYGLHFIIVFCSVLPILGFLTFFLPTDQKLNQWTTKA